jgi:hypothetical protein
MYRVIASDQKEYGPVSADQIRQWIADHRLVSQSLVKAESGGDWRPLSSFPEFASILPVIPAPAAATPLPGPVKTNSMAITGMIMGILSVLFCFCCYGVPFNILGLVFSIIAINQINRNPLTEKGKGMAVAGIVLSIVSFLLAVGLVILVLAIPELAEKLKHMGKIPGQ